MEIEPAARRRVRGFSLGMRQLLVGYAAALAVAAVIITLRHDVT